MKKTISINLSGLMFNIDEDAFSQLSRYLESIKRHFENNKGKDEIFADIESRIAELLQMKISDSKQVVNLSDVNEVIGMLGQPIEMDEHHGEDESASERAHTSAKKRLFRDPDNQKIAGVASGIAAYFVVDPLWIRLLFILLFIVSGSGLLIYIVLWVVTPVARTTAEKLEMHNEPINVKNIEKAIMQEFETVKGKVNEYTTDAKESFVRTGRNVRNGSKSVFDPVWRVLRTIVRIFAIMVGFLFLFIGLSLILFAGTIFLGWDNLPFINNSDFVNSSADQLIQLFVSGDLSLTLAPIVLSLFIGVPLIMLVYAGLRLIIGRHFRIPNLGLTATILWIASVVGMFYIGTMLLIDFNEEQKVTLSEKHLENRAGKVVYVRFNENMSQHLTMQLRFGNYPFIIEQNADTAMVYSYPSMKINKSSNNNTQVSVISKARGHSYEKALQRAEGLKYTVAVNDSVIELSNWYSFEASEKIRGQRVEIQLYIPQGQIVYFEQSKENRLGQRFHPYWKRKGFVGKYWMMTADGLELYNGITTPLNR